MKIGLLKDSKFIKKEDLPQPVLVTFSHLTHENLAGEGQKIDMGYVAHWQEQNIKPMVLKTTNAQSIAGFLGSEETNDWVGKKIVLYVDPNVMMEGRLVGGIRCRAPRNQSQNIPSVLGRTAPAPVPAPMPYVQREAEAQQASDNDGGVTGDNVPF